MQVNKRACICFVEELSRVEVGVESIVFVSIILVEVLLEKLRSLLTFEVATILGDIGNLLKREVVEGTVQLRRRAKF